MPITSPEVFEFISEKATRVEKRDGHGEVVEVVVETLTGEALAQALNVVCGLAAAEMQQEFMIATTDLTPTYKTPVI